MTILEFKELSAKPKKKGNKYRAKRITIDGYNFDSQAESQRYAFLKIQKQQGLIKDFEMQVTYSIVINSELICKYRADFVVYYNDGRFEVEDVKSTITKNLPVFKLKQKLMKAVLGIDVKVVLQK